MRFVRSLALCAVFTSGMGCGIVSKDLDGEVRFDFEIDSTDDSPNDRYLDIVTFDPNSNEDVKNNRDKVEEGAVVQIALELTEVAPENKARILAGQVDVKKSGAADSTYIMAVGQWSGIPLYDDAAPGGSPALGQKFIIELDLDSQDKLSALVFEETDPLDFRLNGYGYDDYLQPSGPVKIRGDADVKLEFTVSAP